MKSKRTGLHKKRDDWNMKRKKQGFTLAELLIVVAIIAVLVAISIPIFTSQLEKSRRAVDLTNARNIRSALSAAMNDGSLFFQSEDATLYLFVSRNGTNGGVNSVEAGTSIFVDGTIYDGQGHGQNMVWNFLKKYGISNQMRMKQKSTAVDWYGVSIDGRGRSYYYEGNGKIGQLQRAKKYDWSDLSHPAT